MSITAYAAARIGPITQVTVTSDLGGTIYYHWYRDGLYVGRTLQGQMCFALEEEAQARIEVLDTNDADFDPYANAPAAYPPRRTLWWCGSIDPDAVAYRIDQKEGAGDWEALGTIQAAAGQWSYQLLTPRLADLTEHEWRVVPLDAPGNDGDALPIGPETIVRTPDAPAFALTYDSGTRRVTFSEP